jgi:hypothetical protein
MTRAHVGHPAPAAELVRRPGRRGGARNGDHQGPELGLDLTGGSGILVERRASRRDRFEALGLLLGILGILVVVAMTVGAAPPA